VHEADRLTIEYVQARKKHFRILMRQIAFTLGLQAVSGTALLGLGGFLVIQGQLTLGQLVASELIVAVVVGSFAKLGKHMESYFDLLAAVDKLGHLFDLPIERQDGVVVERNAEGAEIRFHNVRLDFDSHRSILNDLTLTISPGERVALYGPAGSGKSLLLEMLYALREPSCGYIEFDGVDLRAIQPAALREQVALVCAVEVFEATIAENITMHRDQINHAEVRQSLESVGLWKEIMQLPQGLSTCLIPGGGILTDSQLIRLMLARALAGRPRLLLIDSIMDQLPDDQLPTVLQALTDGRRDKTIILVTGREMLLDGCDQTLQFGAPDGSEPDSIEKPLPSRNPEASLVRFLAP
jgi:ABC-type bacteriocin/lantibiotic exporter with double-glycine peptidase domain